MNIVAVKSLMGNQETKITAVLWTKSLLCLLLEKFHHRALLKDEWIKDCCWEQRRWEWKWLLQEIDVGLELATGDREWLMEELTGILVVFTYWSMIGPTGWMCPSQSICLHSFTTPLHLKVPSLYWLFRFYSWCQHFEATQYIKEITCF